MCPSLVADPVVRHRVPACSRRSAQDARFVNWLMAEVLDHSGRAAVRVLCTSPPAGVVAVFDDVRSDGVQPREVPSPIVEGGQGRDRPGLAGAHRCPGPLGSHADSGLVRRVCTARAAHLTRNARVLPDGRGVGVPPLSRGCPGLVVRGSVALRRGESRMSGGPLARGRRRHPGRGNVKGVRENGRPAGPEASAVDRLASCWRRRTRRKPGACSGCAPRHGDRE